MGGMMGGQPQMQPQMAQFGGQPQGQFNQPQPPMGQFGGPMAGMGGQPQQPQQQQQMMGQFGGPMGGMMGGQPQMQPQMAQFGGQMGNVSSPPPQAAAPAASDPFAMFGGMQAFFPLCFSFSTILTFFAAQARSCCEACPCPIQHGSIRSSSARSRPCPCPSCGPVEFDGRFVRLGSRNSQTTHIPHCALVTQCNQMNASKMCM